MDALYCCASTQLLIAVGCNLHVFVLQFEAVRVLRISIEANTAQK